MVTGLTVCIDWSDYLAEALYFNRKHFDEYKIITTLEDKKTIELAIGYHCVPVFVERQQPFNKGICVNAGINLIKEGWICILDGDIVLPYGTDLSKMIFENLDEECIYGTDRLEIKSYDHWQQVKPLLNQEGFTTVPDAPIMERIYVTGRGWMPIGFFQLFHSKHGRRYPEEMTEQFHQDLPFALQWPRSKTIFLPDATVLHLQTADASIRGINWFGRSTTQFCS